MLKSLKVWGIYVVAQLLRCFFSFVQTWSDLRSTWTQRKRAKKKCKNLFFQTFKIWFNLSKVLLIAWQQVWRLTWKHWCKNNFVMPLTGEIETQIFYYGLYSMLNVIFMCAWHLKYSIKYFIIIISYRKASIRRLLQKRRFWKTENIKTKTQ